MTSASRRFCQARRSLALVERVRQPANALQERERSTGLRHAFASSIRSAKASWAKLREHRLGALPAGRVERLERLVHEVEHVADLEVAVIGRGGEEHISDALASGEGSGAARTASEWPARRPRVADFDKPPEPVGLSREESSAAWAGGGGKRGAMPRSRARRRTGRGTGRDGSVDRAEGAGSCA